MLGTLEVQTLGSLFFKPLDKIERKILLTEKENIGLQVALCNDLHTLEHARGRVAISSSNRLQKAHFNREIMGPFLENIYLLSSCG